MQVKWRRTGAVLLGAVGLSTLIAAGAAAQNHVEPIRQLVERSLRGWTQSPDVLTAVRAQNAAHAGLDQAEIDRLDKTWRQESKAGGGALIDRVLATPLSTYLKGAKADGKGLFAEIFVMDDKGLNVGQSDITSDYWQGDEAKWQKTFLVGPDALLIDEVELDESSQQFVSQVSLPVVDPETGKPIGAMTVGVNVEALLQ